MYVVCSNSTPLCVVALLRCLSYSASLIRPLSYSLSVFIYSSKFSSFILDYILLYSWQFIFMVLWPHNIVHVHPSLLGLNTSSIASQIRFLFLYEISLIPYTWGISLSLVTLDASLFHWLSSLMAHNTCCTCNKILSRTFTHYVLIL